MFFEESSYEISEGIGPLQVCVLLSYATDAPFVVDVNIMQDSPEDALGNQIMAIPYYHLHGKF